MTGIKTLHNKYVVLRHGTSLANEEGIIVSDPKNGVGGYGLSQKGKQEVEASVLEARTADILSNETVIISSDFSRAHETALIAAHVLGMAESACTIDIRLRERHFGDFEKQANTNYDRVWEIDKDDHTHTAHNVESVASVVARVSSLIDDLEKTYSDKTILLVSHGDTLQMLQTIFEDAHPSQHRSLKHLETAEVRKLN